MDAAWVDRLARAFGSRSSRRAAIGAALGLAGSVSAGREAGAATCGKKMPCGLCRQCKKGKCKRQKDGAVCGNGGVCQSGGCVCSDQRQPCAEGLCCAIGKACSNGKCEACGSSPIDRCVPTVCGRTSGGGACFCTSSVEETPTCVEGLAFDCFACTTDDQCTTHLGKPAVCYQSTGVGCERGLCSATAGALCFPICA